eukprot:8441934-Alexandrium_andersonii.AAC.1
MSASRQVDYIFKVSGSSAFRRAEGLLGRFVGQGVPGVYMPWDWDELAIDGEGLPGLAGYLA